MNMPTDCALVPSTMSSSYLPCVCALCGDFNESCLREHSARFRWCDCDGAKLWIVVCTAERERDGVGGIVCKIRYGYSTEHHVDVKHVSRLSRREYECHSYRFRSNNICIRIRDIMMISVVKESIMTTSLA